VDLEGNKEKRPNKEREGGSERARMEWSTGTGSRTGPREDIRKSTPGREECAERFQSAAKSIQVLVSGWTKMWQHSKTTTQNKKER